MLRELLVWKGGLVCFFAVADALPLSQGLAPYKLVAAVARPVPLHSVHLHLLLQGQVEERFCAGEDAVLQLAGDAVAGYLEEAGGGAGGADGLDGAERGGGGWVEKVGRYVYKRD